MKPDSQKQRWSAQRLIRILVVILLVLTIFFMGKQVDWLLDPVRQFFSIVGLPIILAGVLYYLLNPLVDWLEKRFRVRRTWTIIGLFIVVVALLALGIIAIIPTIRDQTLSIINDWPIIGKMPVLKLIAGSMIRNSVVSVTNLKVGTRISVS